MSRVAIVAALEREVRPLIRGWRVVEKNHAGCGFRFFENGDTVLVCGGIGAKAARRAAEAVITLYEPRAIWSAGFAGALDDQLRVGDLVLPGRVVDAGDGSSIDLRDGSGVLVSFGAVASPEQKGKLRESYAALAVDMEAAAVALAAEARGVPFRTVKVISDETKFAFPSMERFVDSDGKFLEARFALFVVPRPWLWLRTARLAWNSNRASRVLCEWLGKNNGARIADSAGAVEGVARQ